MKQKSEYLYLIGVRLLLCNAASRKDTIETVQDYSENIDAALHNGLSFDEVKVKLGTPNEITLALREQTHMRRLSSYLPALSIAAIVCLWGFLTFSPAVNGGIRLPVPQGILESVSIVVSFILVWTALRLHSLSTLFALKKPYGNKNKALPVMNLLPLCSVIFLYAACIYLLIYRIQPPAIDPWRVGPAITRVMNIALFANAAVAASALYRSIRYSPYFICLFLHALGAIGFLTAFGNTMRTLTDTETFWARAVSCLVPYVVGIFFALLTLILVSTFRKKGEVIWMPR